MSATHYTLNNRRSARLAAKRGAATEVTPVGVSQRRTSPRLAPMYAAKAAAEKRREEAFRLVDSVLAFAARRGAAAAPKANDLFIRLWKIAFDVIYGILATGAYGTTDMLTEEEVVSWMTVPAHKRLIATTIRGWIRDDPVRVCRWGETEVEEALLGGPFWSAVMAAMR